ncbi:hypothetical protein E3J84_02670 [Candidatus Aerophobetes bacterium]|uniref:Uncharacterized protein n=1 Tax=Aerophobetes bacterium TaxID=2030807 RepID=A0A523S0L9_UNCAE|nr:MAG: hypothetical protein E3J84_02670 [Candidatus Aerophobetes bacterium]
MAGKRIDKVEKEKRIYQVSLLLRRRPTGFIVDFIRQQWGVERAQAFNYIKLAKEEWARYFANMKSSGIGYHISQMREIKDKAYGENDLRLVFDVAKEEAKLMGMEIERKEIGGPGSFAEWMKDTIAKEKELKAHNGNK